RFVEAKLSDDAKPAQSTPVLVELSIDEQGRVLDASVVEGAGEPFDTAVLEAVRAFEFEPARQGETPVAVKIRYRYIVEPGPQPEPEPAPTPEAAPLPPPAAAAPPPPAAPAAKAEAELEEFEATAEVEAPPREVTKRTMKTEQLTRIPGTRGDALKAIEVMPGVARTSGFGDPLLRGAAWNDSATYLDGVPVPFLFHFGGLTSFMNSRLIERVDLYPSNFGTRYGRLSGGIVEVHARDPRSDRLHGVLDLNLIDSSVLVETPLGENTAIALAGRRSNIDFFFENFVPEDSYSVVAAPLYWDYQGLLSHRFDSDNQLRLLSYGGRDTIELFFADPADEDPAIAGNISGSIQFHRAQAELHSKLSRTATQELVLMLGVIDVEQRFGELVQEADGPEVYARGEWSFELLPELRLTTGGDYAGWYAGGSYHGPLPTQTEGDPNQRSPLSTQRLVSLELDTMNVLRGGLYADLGIRPVEALLLTPGVRADYYENLDDWSVDPRFSARYELTSQTALKGGVGLYSQPPEYWQVLPVIGNPALKPFRALHTSLGVEQRLGDGVKLGVEGFYKRLEDRIVGTEGGRPPRMVNEGEGRIVGGEFSAEVTPQEGTFGYAAYTLSRSERRDLDGRWRLFDQDQTHILTLAAGHELGAGWEVGARFRLVTGNPVTPVVDSVYDARSGVYVPIYGEVNSERDPTFHQLDVRVEKQFRVGTGSVAVYLDVQNVYNAENLEGARYSYDYREKEAVSGLPFLPNLGLRGEL
ncbi:MAG TPA: TonB-dependent receptor, partial [Polyangiaceae bacterium]|nr:TonB-dependent receptor [Polyangiaceae bacterium]